MLKLRCTNEACESHKNDQHLFTVNGVAVDDDAELAENLKRLEADAFTCAFCQSDVDLVEVEQDCVTCKFCGKQVPAATAHRHDGGWVGDDCCWDERLRTTE